MNVVIVCQHCKKPLKIPAEGIGKKVRCPACKTVFVGQRDEFKPRAATSGEPGAGAPPIPSPLAKKTTPTANRVDEEIVIEDEDATEVMEDAAPDEEVLEEASEEIQEEEDFPTKKRPTAVPKKKSKLLLILVILFVVLFILPALGCGALLLMGLLAMPTGSGAISTYPSP